jgi:hypothetical protein
MEPLVPWTLSQGTVVHVDGIPFYLADRTTILGTLENLKLAPSLEYLARMTVPHPSDEA